MLNKIFKIAFPLAILFATCLFVSKKFTNLSKKFLVWLYILMIFLAGLLYACAGFVLFWGIWEHAPNGKNATGTVIALVSGFLVSLVFQFFLVSFLSKLMPNYIPESSRDYYVFANKLSNALIAVIVGYLLLLKDSFSSVLAEILFDETSSLGVFLINTVYVWLCTVLTTNKIVFELLLEKPDTKKPIELFPLTKRKDEKEN